MLRRPFSLARYLGVVVLLALGLMAKPMLVTLPFVLLLLDYWPLGRFGRGGMLSRGAAAGEHVAYAAPDPCRPAASQRDGMPPPRPLAES